MIPGAEPSELQIRNVLAVRVQPDELAASRSNNDRPLLKLGDDVGVTPDGVA